MKSQKIVYYASGENSGTYSPLCFIENFNGDINEMTERFMSHDCNIYVPVPYHVIREILIPEWMDESYYLENYISYKFAIGLGGEYAKNLTKNGMNNFIKLSEQYQYFIGVYMSGNTKNNFKLSIREQIEKWLNTEQPKYKEPLSDTQFCIASKFVRLYEAKQIANQIYWDR